MTPESTSKPTAEPTTKSAAKFESVESNSKSTSSSSSAISRELVTSASASMDATTSPITLNQNTFEAKASYTFEAVLFDWNASFSADSAANTDTAESIAIETRVDPSMTTKQKVAEPATDDRSAPEVIFELFAELPVELRLKIWKFVPAPRLVVVRFHEDRRKKTHKFAASSPMILRICQESRHEGLKIYHRAFDSKWALNGAYFNFKIDTLVLSYANPKQREFFLHKLKPQNLSRIEYITLEYAKVGPVPKLVGLKEVIYTVEPNYYHRHISSCSSHDGSIHTIKDLSETNPYHPPFSDYLKRAQEAFDRFKERFKESDEGSKLRLSQGVLCMSGMYREGQFSDFK
jgi:2EXR family